MVFEEEEEEEELLRSHFCENCVSFLKEPSGLSIGPEQWGIISTKGMLSQKGLEWDFLGLMFPSAFLKS